MAGQLELLSSDETTRVITMDELRALWAKLKARGELWNGMTGHYLRQRYGDRLCHVRGQGWFVRPAGDTAERHTSTEREEKRP